MDDDVIRDSIKDYYYSAFEKDVFDKAFSLAKGLVDKIRPEWERDIAYREQGIKLLQFMVETRNTAIEKADQHYQDVYHHYIELYRGLFGVSRKNRWLAHEEATEAANARFEYMVDSFIEALTAVAPIFFTPDGHGGTSIMPELDF